ncbi:oxygen-insensitive NADPH nitroreductase [Staphylococcus xylosus]
MNETINLLQNHSSVRKFQNKSIPESHIDEIFKAANQASSFSLLQVVSIIRITDTNLRQEIMELSGHQPYINETSEFWIFCSDFNRNHQIAPEIDISYADFLEIGSVDVGLMAQNAMVAAESLGLGGVYIGGVRINIEKLTELLALPKHVVPLVGLCIGYPEEEKAPIKPRLPKDIVMHNNQYEPFSVEDIEEYDEKMKSYYKNRPIKAPFSTRTVKGWSEHINEHLARSYDPNMLDYLNTQGYIKK